MPTDQNELWEALAGVVRWLEVPDYVKVSHAEAARAALKRAEDALAASPVASREDEGLRERRGFPSRTEWLEWRARQPNPPTPEEAFIGGWHLRSKDRDYEDA